jgi:hypothetical protein
MRSPRSPRSRSPWRRGDAASNGCTQPFGLQCKTSRHNVYVVAASLGLALFGIYAFWCSLNIIDKHHIDVTIRETALHSYGEKSRHTLVSYVFADTDPQYRSNLDVFIRQGILQDDSAEYVIIIQMSDVRDPVDLPQLPAHARYVKHVNNCYDWCVLQC